ncbi:MAG: DNA polymerase III subunit delta [Candidatus Krumholzibacteriia bacterium]
MNARAARGREPGFDDLIAELRARKIRPVYVIEGEDRRRVEETVRWLRDKLLDAAAQAFNFHLHAGDGADLRLVVQQARNYPMLAARQVIWVRDCDRCSLAEGREAALERYLAEPVPETVLILSADKLDGRRRWVKLAREGGGWYRFVAPEGAELVKWARAAAEREGLALTPDLAAELCERVGGDLRALGGEIAKLALAAGEKGSRLSAAEVRELVLAQREIDPWELVGALSGRDPTAVLRVWRRLAGDGHTAQEVFPLLVFKIRQLALAGALLAEGMNEGAVMKEAKLWGNSIGDARRVIGELGPAGLTRALEACRRAEAALKSSPLKPELILEKALLEICGGSA